jgi:hypothetical protein
MSGCDANGYRYGNTTIECDPDHDTGAEDDCNGAANCRAIYTNGYATICADSYSTVSANGNTPAGEDGSGENTNA